MKNLYRGTFSSGVVVVDPNLASAAVFRTPFLDKLICRTAMLVRGRERVSSLSITLSISLSFYNNIPIFLYLYPYLYISLSLSL